MANDNSSIPLVHNITYAEDEATDVAYSDEDIVYFSNLSQLRKSSSYTTEKLVIVCCTEGRLSLSVDGQDKTVSANQLLVIMPQASINTVMYSLNAKCAILCLSMHFIKNFIDARDLISTAFMVVKNPLITVPADKINGFMQLVSVFGVMSDKDHIYYNKIITKLVEATLFAVFGFFQKMYESEYDAYITKMNQGEILFRKFMSLLVSNTSNARSVSYYSAELFVTPKYLSHVCKEISGKTASQLIKEQVVKNIKLLLRFTDKPIKDIVKELGFPNESFFGQYVKTNLGYTPVQYRNLSEEEIDKHNKELYNNGL